MPGAELPVRCTHCGRAFAVVQSLAGGLANCPGCGRATPVEGLRDPFWRVLQAGAVAALLLATVLCVQAYGVAAGMAVALCGGALLWLFSRAL